LCFFGQTEGSEDIKIDGDIKSNKFIVKYMKDGKTIGVASQGRPHETLFLYDEFCKNKQTKD
jgi:hypothetical protein